MSVFKTMDWLARQLYVDVAYLFECYPISQWPSLIIEMYEELSRLCWRAEPVNGTLYRGE